MSYIGSENSQPISLIKIVSTFCQAVSDYQLNLDSYHKTKQVMLTFLEVKYDMCVRIPPPS